MTTKTLLIAVVALALIAGGLILVKSESDATNTSSRITPPVAPRAEPARAEPSHAPSTAVRVPAYQSASEARDLPQTLAPTQFIGKTLDAYTVAKKIPKTLAQLPCYCHCDQGFGHKSLHTCFVDDHAAHCAVCVDEALLAYRLQLDEKLSPEQIRDRIVEKYSAEHQHSH